MITDTALTTTGILLGTLAVLGPLTMLTFAMRAVAQRTRTRRIIRRARPTHTTP